MTLPDRRSIRLSGYDYSSVGLYFVTICTYEKRCTLGRIVDGRMQLGRLGTVVRECWVQIPYHFARVELDAFVMMPNHVHGVLALHKDWRAQHAAPLRAMATLGAPGKPIARRSLAAIIRSFKGAVSKLARERAIYGTGTLWQRNYYEHIVRNGDDLAEIRQYIFENPKRWDADRENPRKLMKE